MYVLSCTQLGTTCSPTIEHILLSNGYRFSLSTCERPSKWILLHTRRPSLCYLAHTSEYKATAATATATASSTSFLHPLLPSVLFPWWCCCFCFVSCGRILLFLLSCSLLPRSPCGGLFGLCRCEWSVAGCPLVSA